MPSFFLVKEHTTAGFRQEPSGILALSESAISPFFPSPPWEQTCQPLAVPLSQDGEELARTETIRGSRNHQQRSFYHCLPRPLKKVQHWSPQEMLQVTPIFTTLARPKVPSFSLLSGFLSFLLFSLWQQHKTVVRQITQNFVASVLPYFPLVLSETSFESMYRVPPGRPSTAVPSLSRSGEGEGSPLQLCRHRDPRRAVLHLHGGCLGRLHLRDQHDWGPCGQYGAVEVRVTLPWTLANRIGTMGTDQGTVWSHCEKQCKTQVD